MLDLPLSLVPAYQVLVRHRLTDLLVRATLVPCVLQTTLKASCTEEV